MGTADKRKANKAGHAWAKDLDERFAVQRVEVNLSTAIESYLKHCAKAGLTSKTVRGYRYHLAYFLRHQGDISLSDWDEDEALDKVSEFLDWRLEACQMLSIKADRIVLSGFFNYLRSKRWWKGINPADAKLAGFFPKTNANQN